MYIYVRTSFDQMPRQVCELLKIRCIFETSHSVCIVNSYDRAATEGKGVVLPI